MLSIKEKKVFERDKITLNSVFRFEFNENGILERKDIITEKEFSQLDFSNDKTRVIREAYGITDQLYEAFTRGQ